MARQQVTTVRIDPALKAHSTEILDELGLSMSTAITLFLRAVVRAKGLPFDLRLEDDNSQNKAETEAGID